jgi:hypothetical protein
MNRVIDHRLSASTGLKSMIDFGHSAKYPHLCIGKYNTGHDLIPTICNFAGPGWRYHYWAGTIAAQTSKPESDELVREPFISWQKNSINRYSVVLGVSSTGSDPPWWQPGID